MKELNTIYLFVFASLMSPAAQIAQLVLCETAIRRLRQSFTIMIDD